MLVITQQQFELYKHVISYGMACALPPTPPYQYIILDLSVYVSTCTCVLGCMHTQVSHCAECTCICTCTHVQTRQISEPTKQKEASNAHSWNELWTQPHPVNSWLAPSPRPSLYWLHLLTGSVFLLLIPATKLPPQSVQNFEVCSSASGTLHANSGWTLVVHSHI